MAWHGIASFVTSIFPFDTVTYSVSRNLSKDPCTEDLHEQEKSSLIPVTCRVSPLLPGVTCLQVMNIEQWFQMPIMYRAQERLVASSDSREMSSDGPGVCSLELELLGAKCNADQAARPKSAACTGGGHAFRHTIDG